jgi:hypothetical protein
MSVEQGFKNCISLKKTKPLTSRNCVIAAYCNWISWERDSEMEISIHKVYKEMLLDLGAVVHACNYRLHGRQKYVCCSRPAWRKMLQRIYFKEQARHSGACL